MKLMIRPFKKKRLAFTPELALVVSLFVELGQKSAAVVTVTEKFEYKKKLF